MDKFTVAPTPPEGQASANFDRLDVYKSTKALKFHPVMIELSRMEAALWLLKELDGQGIHTPDKEVDSWTRGMIADTLEDAVATARGAFVKAAEAHRKAVA